MAETNIGLLHPGEMGSAVGAAARKAGARVLWASEGRSSRSRDAAAAAGLEDAGSLAALVAQCDVIFSVCPPHAAVQVARAVAALRFAGVYVDANAVSPGAARDIARVVECGGATFVDGGIIGPPPATPGTTRLYLSAPGAERIAALFVDSPLEAVALEAPLGAASALKMAYASWTKGSAALLMSVRAFAIAEGVDAELQAEWHRSLPDLAARSESAVNGNARKAWRFVGEMEEIAASFAEAGVPDGFALASRDVYQRLERYKNTAKPPLLADVAAAIRKTLARY